MRKVWEGKYMKGSNLDIDKMLQDDAANIEIDMKFKNDLKKRIMASAVVRENNVIELPRRSKTPYMKVAGWVVFAAISGSTIFGAGSLYSHLVSNNSSINVNPAVAEANKTKSEPAKSGTENLAQNNVLPGSQIVIPNVPDKGAVSGEKSQSQNGSKNITGNTGSGGGTSTPTANKPTSGSTANTNGGTNVKTETDGSKQNTAVPGKDSSTNNAAVEEKTNTIKLPLVAGRYIIQNISTSKSETVQTLPDEYKSLTAEECAKLPVTSNDKTVFEKDGSVGMISHVSGKEIPIDKGKTPVNYAAIGLVGYIKDTDNGSEIWVFDSNSTNKYKLLSSGDSKHKYLNMFWSSDGKSLYVLEANTATNKYDLVKLTIDIQ